MYENGPFVDSKFMRVHIYDVTATNSGDLIWVGVYVLF